MPDHCPPYEHDRIDHPASDFGCPCVCHRRLWAPRKPCAAPDCSRLVFTDLELCSRHSGLGAAA